LYFGDADTVAASYRSLLRRQGDVPRTYKVNLAPKDSEYLRLDMPMKEQSESVKAAARKLLPDPSIDTLEAGIIDDEKDIDTLREKGRAKGLPNDEIERGVSIRLAWLEDKKDTLNRRTADDYLHVGNMTGREFYIDLKKKYGSAKAASLALRDAGVPGSKFKDVETPGHFSYVIFDDSLVTVEEKFSLWPRKPVTPRSELERDLSKVMSMPEHRGFVESAREAVAKWWAAKEDLGNEVIRGLFDIANPIKVAEIRQYGKVRDAVLSAHKMWQLAQNTESQIASVIGVETPEGVVGGPLIYEDASGIDVRDDGKPLIEVFRPVTELGEEALNAWEAWMIARRAKQIKAEDAKWNAAHPDEKSRNREKNVEDWFIAKYEGVDKTYVKGGVNPFQKVADDWRTFNGQMLDFEPKKPKAGQPAESTFRGRRYHQLIERVVAKVKHPGYVALHHLKSSFSTKKLVEIIRSGETAEVLVSFPEWQKPFDQVQAAYDGLVTQLEQDYAELRSIDNRKDFAMAAKLSVLPATHFFLRDSRVPSVKEGLKLVHIDKFVKLLGVEGLVLEGAI